MRLIVLRRVLEKFDEVVDILEQVALQLPGLVTRILVAEPFFSGLAVLGKPVDDLCLFAFGGRSGIAGLFGFSLGAFQLRLFFFVRNAGLGRLSKRKAGQREGSYGGGKCSHHGRSPFGGSDGVSSWIS